jgi:hypothetical protein
MDLTAMNLIAPAVFLKCAWFGPRYFVCGRENELTTLYVQRKYSGVVGGVTIAAAKMK